ncbi:YiiX family permuted papain-like enzyme [Flavobacterium taihuense]|uniref:YiiX family permuted papain-like enzyme n=1 Tax=Flavobacterium taihuense TaxID=2857508 RepID=A0ABS6XXJ4_9FLAO|nr:YiiX family permuted papain-like enzyme [Flavobacterium taihuense]MBW4361408.1 YiiX family permuted papain-like enzyme [Flavobacterium taihuense]
MKKTKYIFAIITFLMSFGCALFIANSMFGNIIFGTRAVSILDKIQESDMIFQTSQSRQSEAIRIATNSKFSHCGIVFIEKGKKYVFEAVQPVKYTPIEAWINRGKEGHFVVTRIKNASLLLNPQKVQKMKDYANLLQNKDYDHYFEWSDDKIYCSELVWKIYKNGAGIELCPLQKLKNFNLKDPKVQVLLTERYGNTIPLNESVIAPSNLKHSNIVTTIIDTY